MNKLKNREFLYHTSRGTLYNLTKENQKNLDIKFVTFQIADLARMQKVFEKLPENLSFKKFYAFQDKKIILTSVDFCEQRNRGSQNQEGIEINDFGYKKLTNENYLKFAKLIQPDILISLTEEGRDSTFQQAKSSKRNVQKTIKFLNETIEFKKTHNQKWKIYAAFQGSFQEEFRQQNLQEILKFQDEIEGIVCYNLYHEQDRNKNVKIEENIYNFEQRLKIYQILQNVNQKIDLILPSDGNYLKVLESLHFNFNKFETQFPFITAKKGKACLFNIKQWCQYSKHYINNNYDISDEQVINLFKQKNELKFLDLNDQKFAKDLSAIDSDCECLCCKNYSRAYINHLLKHQEMTGNVLLTIHNTYQHSQFMQYINMEEFQQNQNRYIVAFWFLFTQN